MSRVLSVVRHKRLTIGQATAAVVTTAPAPTLNLTADVVPVRPRGVRTIRRHKRVYFGKPATTQLVSEDFYAALNARMDGAFAAVTIEATARVDGDSAVASTLTALSSSFTSYQATANASLGTLGTRMTTAEAGIVSANAAITSGDAAVASTVTALSASFTTYQTAANTQLGTLDTRVTTAEAGIISANTARADGDAAVASTVTALSASFTGYQTTANGRLGSLETTAGSLTTRMTSAEAGITSANTARADGDAAVASTVTALTASFNSYTSTANGRLGSLEDTTGTLTTRITSAEAGIISANTARADGDAAVASTVTSLTTSFNSYTSTANGRLGALEGTTGTLGTRMTSAEAAITSEASTRASGDSANASAISALTATVSSNQSSLSASITAEQTVRAVLVRNLGSGASQQVFKQASAPTLDQVSPPGKNRLNQSSCLDGNRQFWKYGGGYGGGHGISLFGETDTWTPPGARTIFANLHDSPSSGTAFEIYNDGNDADPRYAVTAGKRYEFSAYLANHRLQFVLLRLIFLNAASEYLWETQSAHVTTQGGGGNNTLAGYERAFVIGTAPANATTCYVSVYGVANGEAYPYIMMCKPFFGLAETDQYVPSPWQDANTGAIWIDTAGNNKIHVWNGFAWEAKDDTRIAATASQVSTIQTTVNGHTASINSQQTSIDGLSALATLTVNGGGAIAGYSIFAGGGSSSFKIQAENFEIVGSGGGATSPFRVAGGVVYINEARIANGAVSEVTSGMGNGYVDVAVTVEPGAKLLFILSTLGDGQQGYGSAGNSTLELYDLSGSYTICNVDMPYTNIATYHDGVGEGGSPYYTYQTLFSPVTYQWILTPSYSGYRAFRLRNNLYNAWSGQARVVLSIIQMKK